jgi:acetyl esterase/lipase
MQQLDRRQLIWLGGALALGANRLAGSAEPAAPPPINVPENWRRATRIALWPGRPPGSSGSPPAAPAGWPEAYKRSVAMPELHVFPATRSNGASIVVMPGGAYWFVSVMNEGAELAPLLNERGYTVFVLTYRLPGEGWQARSDVPLQDAQRAMRLVRSRAKEFRLDPAKVAALGFSAGGHLAATLATRHGEKVYSAVDTADSLDARPWAAGLIYPVITLKDPWTHEMSRQLLLGDKPSAAQVDRRSAELHVDAATSPLFLCHAFDDTAVPVENSLRMLSAMREAKRPVEAHLLQEGGHAFGIGRKGTPSALWVDTLCNWLDRTR